MSNNTLSRRSTLRTARGLSDDYRPSPASSTRDLPTSPLSASTTPTTPASTTSSTKTNESYDNSPTILARSNTLGRAAARERRQTLRGGSAESALGSPGGRSLVGEGLRAAGLSRRVGVGTSVRGERTISAGVAEIREMDRASTISGRSSRASSRRTEESPTTAAPPTTSSPDVFKDGRRVDWSPESSDALARPRREFSRTLPPRASTSMADYSYTSRTRQRHTHTQHSDSEDDHDHDIDEEHEKEREGRRDLRTYKSSTHSYNMINSREASLTRREQSLLERERELGRKERELERDRERAASALGRHTPTPYASSTSTIRERFGSIRRTPGGSTTSSSSSHTHSQSQSQSQSHHSQPSQTQTEHAKLMVDSLTMFESQLHKLSRVLHGNNSTNSTSNSPSNRDNLNKSGGPGATSSPSPSPAPGTNHIDMLTRTAQTLVISAERLNTMLKAGNARALDAQIEAEVEGDDLPPPSSASTSGNRGGGGGGSSLADVWRRIGGEYREGVRVSDELVRAVTGLLLGVGRIVKEYGSSQVGGYAGSEVGGGYSGGTPRGSPVVHWRSVSLGEDEVRVRAGEEFGRESRRSWEPSLSNGSGGGGGGGMSSAASTSTAGPSTGSREEALRRLAGIRSDSPLARASPAFQAVRELDRLETIASPGMGTGLGLPKVNIPAARRLFAPSQQREMALVAGGGSGGGGGGGGGSGYDYENDPSPTPLSRTLRVYDRGGGGEALSPSQQVQQLYQTQSPSVVPQHLDGAGTGTLERSRTITLPSVGQGQGHHGHVFETPLRRNVTISVPSGGGGGRAEGGDGTLSSRDRHERRKISVASIATIRAATSNTTNPTTATTTTTSSATSSSNASSALHHQPPGFSALTTPSGATTAVTLGGGGIAVGMARTESGTTTATSSSSAVTSGSSSLYSTATRPTFSRPEGILGLQQQLEGYRKRAENEHVGVDGNALDSSGSGGEGGGGKRRYGNSISLMTPESERETRRKTYGVGSRVGARVSLDSPTGGNGGGGGDGGGSGRPVVVDLTVNAADRSAAATISGSAAGPGRKERRRTVTDIWPRS
ncbi:hypothetical protein P691DRAFT_787394 [Macrolepiota fuliginosa MF-IS2]|uniref:Uncharacterized protein n=1 Tax=Macrolepiota fuliginosa MF-IS2 TaxID=1400762 RepID=A0A9P5X3H0_9AGAR|nr:hypothetical protein P691DRAFT_787394 [Macrolepiota fuliginosa MF-IS2]